MRTTPMKLLTILVTDTIEDALVEEILALGASGCSVVEASGHGMHGDRPSRWQGGNVRIEVIVGEPVVERILAHLRDRYVGLHPMVAWIADVDAWPAERFA